MKGYKQDKKCIVTDTSMRESVTKSALLFQSFA